MTVISLVQSNIIHRRSSAYKEEILQKNKVRKFLAIVLIGCIIFVILLYVAQINSITAKGYKIRGFKKQIGELEDTNRALQVNISNLKSMGNLQSKTRNLDMVKAQNFEYVTLPSATVVVAE